MPTGSAIVQVMVDAARKTARQLIRDFGEVAELQVSKKGAADYVSAADLKAEQTLWEMLSKARPGYGFLAEERGMVEGTDKTHTFIVDPLDGTTNFLHSIPQFAINIALERDGQVVAAVTYNPVMNELFWAEKGKGAYLNDRRLRVAAGRYDGFWERSLNPWDIAAGALLITEAGGRITSADGGDFDPREGTVLAANLELHPQILELLKTASA